MKDMEFEEMHQQIAILKDKVDKQDIVNDKLLRETMKIRAKAINYTSWVSYIGAGLCILLYPLLMWAGLFSPALTAFTCAMMLFCIVSTYLIHRPVNRTDLMTADLTTVRGVMAKFKKQYDFWLHYVTPTLLIPWLTWAIYDYAWVNAPEGVAPWKLALPLLVGAAIGGVIGYMYHRKAVKAAKDIINVSQK